MSRSTETNQVWDAIGGYDPERASLTTWLTRLARNAALNRRRANARRREEGCLDESVFDSADGPEQSAIKAEDARALWDAVSRLGRLYRIRKRLQDELGGVYHG